MNIDKFLEILIFSLPALITGLIAFYFFKTHTLNEDNRRNFLLRQKGQKIALPLRLQAYERLALFLERISPEKLLVRIKPTGKDVINYQNKLISSIEQEFEHNLAQQIYVTDKCWDTVVTSKNAVSQLIRLSTTNKDITSPEELREFIIKKNMEQDSPTKIALLTLKNEVKKLF